jgi:PKD repeat protein
MGLKRFSLILCIIIFLSFDVRVNAFPDPEAVLHLSIPTGTYLGSNPDPWLSECWLLNISGFSATFTLRVEDASEGVTSYDTHLIIALNDAAYENLVSLKIDSTILAKTAFKKGTPKPYGIWTWPSGDVYPTWFNDALVNLGTIPPKGCRDTSISASFSQATNIRMHFDAYGSSICGRPCSPDQITRNPLQQDSTVLFSPKALLPPNAEFTYSPLYPQVYETVTFNASLSYDPDGSIVSYCWNFGDGNITTSNNPIITHYYGAPATYTVNLTVTDNDCLTNSTTKQITVRKHPVAAFTYSPLSPQVCQNVTFDASQSTPNGGYIISYEWDFGDCSPHNYGVNATYHYASAGNYTVTLNVTDSEGKWDATSKIITVKPAPPPEAEFKVKIEGKKTWPGNEYNFTYPTYCKNFQVEVWVQGYEDTDVKDLYAYEFWLFYDPNYIQIVNHTIKHIHAKDFVILEEADCINGIYKQAVTALDPASGFNGTAALVNLEFHITKDACYPDIYHGELRLENTKMSDSCGRPVSHSVQNGYFNILSTKPKIRVEHQGGTNVTMWRVNEIFTVDIVVINITRMKSFYLQLRWCEALDTDYQNVEVTNFLPPPYTYYRLSIEKTTLRIWVKAFEGKPPINGTGTIMKVTFKVNSPWPDSLPKYTRIDHGWTVENYTCSVEIVEGWVDVYCPEYREMKLYDCNGVDVQNLNYVFTPRMGDMDLDGKVNIKDISLISKHYGEIGGPFDLDRDGYVDLFDVVIVAKNFGKY